MTKNTRQFLFAGYTYDQEQQFKRIREEVTIKIYEINQLRIRSDQAAPVRVPQYERD